MLAGDVTSRSYLTLRPRFEINLPERLSLFRTRMDAREGGHGGALQAVAMYARTTYPAGIARYFLPGGKDYIIVGEDVSACAINRSRDVNAFHLGILTANQLDQDGSVAGFNKLTFQSILSLCPRQTLTGVGFSYQHRLPNHFWLDVSVPIFQVKNQLGLTETIQNSGGGAVPTGYFGSAISALGNCNTDRLYGRITNAKLKKTKLAFIEARVGRDILWESCLVGGFLGAVIPTGNKPCGRYLFEPIVGNNGHWGVMVGSYGIFEILHDSSDRTLSAQYNIATRYLVSNEQIRSFDLRGKPWSRYMRVWKNNNNGLELAETVWQSRLDYLINYSTLCVRVKPDANLDVAANMIYKDRSFQIDVGYNAYARKAEDIRFTHAIKGNIGLPAIKYYIDGVTIPYTESKADINTTLLKIDPGYTDQVINPTGSTQQATYLSITTDDLDPNSGAHPACLAYQVHGALGYTWDKITYPTFINGGISYEFSYDNTFTNRWLAWFKVGVSF